MTHLIETIVSAPAPFNATERSPDALLRLPPNESAPVSPASRRW